MQNKTDNRLCQPPETTSAIAIANALLSQKELTQEVSDVIENKYPPPPGLSKM